MAFELNLMPSSLMSNRDIKKLRTSTKFRLQCGHKINAM
jgi:hypothetical protein